MKLKFLFIFIIFMVMMIIIMTITVAATAGLLVAVNVKYDTAAMPEPNDENIIIFFFI
jgi:hypothetical protein